MRRKRKIRQYEETSYRTTPKCITCGKDTMISRTRMDGQGDGLYLICETKEHEQFVRMDDLSGIMRRMYAKDGSDLPRARQSAYMAGAENAVRELKVSAEYIRRLHVPLDEL